MKGEGVNSKSTKERLWARLHDAEQRNAFAGAQPGPHIAAQIRANRENRGWFQGELGQRAGMKQTQIARLENPNYEQFTLTTLRRLAEAFDVALLVRFVPFSELVDRVADFSLDNLVVLGFEKEQKLRAISEIDTYRQTPAAGQIEELGLEPKQPKKPAAIISILRDGARNGNIPTQALA